MARGDSYPPAKRPRFDSQAQPPKKQRYTYGAEAQKRDDRAYAAGRDAAKARNKQSINDLKSKIRDTKRLLNRAEKLPVDVRIEKERALKGYERDLEQAESKKARSAMIGKYHFVRFLERKTATSRLKRLLREKSQLEERQEDAQAKDTKGEEQAIAGRTKRLNELEELISMARTDIDYTIYSPLTEKYISLYPNNQKNKDGDNSKPPPPEADAPGIIRSDSGQKPPLWYTVRKCMEDGTQDLLRDGKLGVGLSGEVKNKPGTADEESGTNLVVHSRRNNKAKNATEEEDDSMSDGGVPLYKGAGTKRNRNDDMAMDEGEESDGGFFEM